MKAIQYCCLTATVLISSMAYADEPASPLDAMQADMIPAKLKPTSPIPNLAGVIQFIPNMEFSKTKFGSITQLTYSVDGKHIVVGMNNPSQLRVLDAVSFHEIEQTTGEGSVFSQLSPTGQWVFADTLFQLNDKKLIDTKWKPNRLLPETAKAWSPDGKRAAFSGSTGSLQLWDLSRGTPLIYADCQVDSSIISLCYSPDGKHLASGHSNGSVRLWNLGIQPPQEIFRVSAHPKGTREIIFSQDGRFLYSIGSQGTKAQRWSHENGRLHRLDTSPESSFGAARQIALAPDGSRLAISRSDGAVELYKITAEEITLEWKLDRVHRSSVEAIAFSPDGKTLLSGGMDHCLVSWNIGKWLPSVNRQMTGSENLFLPYRFSDDGSVLLVRDHSWDYPIVMGDTQPKLVRLGLRQEVEISVSNHGRFIAVANEDQYHNINPDRLKREPSRELDKNLHLYKLTTKELSKLHELGGPRVVAGVFSPNQTHLVELTGPWDKNRVWNLTEAKPQAIDFQPEHPNANHFPVRSLHASFSSSGKLLATLDVTSSKDEPRSKAHCYVSLWDATSWKRQRYWQVSNDTINLLLCFNGRVLAGHLKDGSIQFWDTATGQLRRTLPAEIGAVGCAWSNDGSLLTTIDKTGSVKRWSVETGQQNYEWHLPKYPHRNDTPAPSRNRIGASIPISPFLLSPDGRYVVVSNTDGTIYFFRVP